MLGVEPNILTKTDVRVIQTAFIEWQNNMIDAARQDCYGEDERIVAQRRWPESFEQMETVFSKLNSYHK
jgi:hypothetical protein